MRDLQRSRVYRGEFSTKLAETTKFNEPWKDEAIKYVNWLFANADFIDKFHPSTTPKLTFQKNKGSLTSPSEGFINLSRNSKYILLHEASHWVTPYECEWHGPNFCLNLLWIVDYCLGSPNKLQLEAAFKNEGVSLDVAAEQKRLTKELERSQAKKLYDSKGLLIQPGDVLKLRDDSLVVVEEINKRTVRCRSLNGLERITCEAKNVSLITSKES